MPYALTLSDDELRRYRLMAESARQTEQEYWQLAGLRPGVRVVDVGCGPGAMLAVLAATVAPGDATGIDADPDAVEQARSWLARLAIGNARVLAGRAERTGLPPGTFDVAVLRHVLAHNGGHERDVVDHVATLVRPVGALLMLDIDATTSDAAPDHADLQDLSRRYATWHADRGNDLAVGRRLADLAAAAGLTTLRHDNLRARVTLPPGMRGPAWAARDALTDAGLATPADVARWDAAYAEVDARPERPDLTLSSWIAVCRTQASDGRTG